MPGKRKGAPWRNPRPPAPDLRADWQKAQGARCGCGGSDDMCPCQNENPWPRVRCPACGVSVGEYHKSNCTVLWGGRPPAVAADAFSATQSQGTARATGPASSSRPGVLPREANKTDPQPPTGGDQ